jgi:ADP-ribose pyrophosphatase YjhB (NUDIX family)
MLDLESFHARICSTSCAFIVHQNKILLVKHKKLGIWLAPGGHVEPQELPHQTALRETFEEAGIKGRVISAQPIRSGHNSQYLPLPFAVNLHWISQNNYQARQKDHQFHGCEQHLVYCYLVKPQGSLNLTQNLTETDGIGWFTQKQIQSLDTAPDIRYELTLTLNL